MRINDTRVSNIRNLNTCSHYYVDIRNNKDGSTMRKCSKCGKVSEITYNEYLTTVVMN